MLKPVSKALVVSSVVVVAGVAGSASASAATTRAEYIAQVDPICQTFVDPESSALSAYHKTYKRWVHDFSHGSLKGWVRQTKRTVATLRQFTLVHSSMTEQVAAVPPTPADARLISTWLEGRRQADGYATAAASSLNRFQISRFFKLIRQADSMEAAGLRAINGFGFQVCGVYT